ncbi:hypothetical protein [Brevundimonas vancanneytii]|uniref:Uncharacterized protein n=1 Tax=Brevundimonas vancanneytii TaxID=1325724 RepID=A0A4P1K0U7_9CAUL|nr:hypothetical protein [Brevundimonas vancanneytii]VTO13990.1 Uncharacterised protein [Brevundimonas vancanneytii]
MTSKPNRTRPLDRDGDGRDGGSLPGNKTAPMATAEGDPNRPDDGPPNAQQTPPPPPDATDDLADARTMPGDSPEKLEAIERETDEANAAARAAGGDALAAIAEAEPDLVAQVIEDHADDADTFTAEEMEAADPHAPCSNCGDANPVGVLEDGLCPLCVEDDDDHGDSLAQMTNDANAEAAQIAVRARELRLLVESRRLYKSAEGYSATYGAPYVDQATVDGWIAAGLAENVPTAGICGGIKPTHEARRHLGQLTLNHYAPGTVGAAGGETSDAV